MKTPIRWFRFFTVPVMLASVGATIAAAELSSLPLMMLAAAAGGVGTASLLVGRNIINSRTVPPSTRIVENVIRRGDRRHTVAQH
jgi:hypothetical protein